MSSIRFSVRLSIILHIAYQAFPENGIPASGHFVDGSDVHDAFNIPAGPQSGFRLTLSTERLARNVALTAAGNTDIEGPHLSC